MVNITTSKSNIVDEKGKVISRRKVLTSIGIVGAASLISGSLGSRFSSPVLAAVENKAPNNDKSERFYDDASRLSYRYNEKQPERMISEKLGESVSVADFGAVGDGKTDDTKAFNTAIQHLNSLGGGELFIPNTNQSVYLLKDRVVLFSNLRIVSNGATLKKNGSCNNYYIFVSLSGEKQGYGSSANHITIEGLNIEGSFKDVIGASITLHHSQHVTIKNCTFSECVIGGHAIDLGGCSDVLVSNCIFNGFHIQKGREYVEAIQIDHSTAEGIGTDDPASYDGLACRNVIVQKCSFLPLTLNDNTYPAPNPFGSHSRVVGHNFKNIKFKDNYLEDGSTVPDGAPYSAGLLHFYHIDGLEVSGNVFINNKGNSARVLGLYSIGTAISQKDVAKDSPEKVEYEPVPAKNVWFERNIVKGFNNLAVSRIIYLQGRKINSNNYYLENIRIMNNDFKDCYNFDGSSTNVSSDLIFADKVIGLNISNNHCSSVRRLLYGTGCDGVYIAFNRMIGTYYVPVSIDLSSNVHLTENLVDDFRGGFYLREIIKLRVIGNSFKNEIDDIVSAYGQILSINQGEKFMIKDNFIDGTEDSKISRAISVYAASIDGMVKENWINGFDERLRISNDSENIITD